MDLLVSLEGVQRRVPYKQAAGVLFYKVIPHLSYTSLGTAWEMLRAIYWSLQVADLGEYKRHYLRTWVWLDSLAKKGDLKALTRFICNAHLASTELGLLHGFGLSQARKSKGRTKAAGDPYSDPERYTIYPDVMAKTTWDHLPFGPIKQPKFKRGKR